MMWTSIPVLRSRPLELIFDIPISKTHKFWDWIREGEFRTTRCKKCGTLHFPPVAECSECGKSQVEWVKIKGIGELEAFTHVIARPISFQHREPYTIAIGKLVDGVKVLAWLRDVDITEVEIGMKIKLTAGTSAEGEATYWFTPA